jgi:hypothetical protein
VSEWKWCGDCGHRFDSHEKGLDERGNGYVYGHCTVTNADVPDGCPCEQFYMVDTP